MLMRPASRPFPMCVALLLSCGTLGYAQVPGPLFPASFSGPVYSECYPGGGAVGATEWGIEEVYELTPAVLTIQFTASSSLGANVLMAILVDGSPVGTQVTLAPGQSVPAVTVPVSAGPHDVQFEGGVQSGTCPAAEPYVAGTGTITPQADSAPALSPWGLLLLAVLLAGTSAWVIAKRGSGKTAHLS